MVFYMNNLIVLDLLVSDLFLFCVEFFKINEILLFNSFRMKFWSCCERKTTDFNSFLSQGGCTTGPHVFTAKVFMI